MRIVNCWCQGIWEKNDKIVWFFVRIYAHGVSVIFIYSTLNLMYIWCSSEGGIRTMLRTTSPEYIYVVENKSPNFLMKFNLFWLIYILINRVLSSTQKIGFKVYIFLLQCWWYDCSEYFFLHFNKFVLLLVKID